MEGLGGGETGGWRDCVNEILSFLVMALLSQCYAGGLPLKRTMPLAVPYSSPAILLSPSCHALPPHASGVTCR